MHANSGRVLVVDDDRILTTLVASHLDGAGHRVECVDSAARTRARLAQAEFDLVLLDVGLPDADGFELCRELKGSDRWRDLPVIFMTALGGESEMVRGFDVGGVDYVVKPFEPRALTARVGTHVALARLSRGLQSALDARTRDLQAAHRRMRELDSQMALTAERERRHLADQLHDNTIQQLSLARILLDGDERDGSHRVRGLLDSSLAQLRTLLFELSPPILYQGGLEAALEWLAGQLGSRWGLGYRVVRRGRPRPLPDDLKVTLFQAARELMANAGRHARASCAEVGLEFAADALTLSVSDDGIGMNPQARNRQDGGFGLFSLGSRIELLGGELRIDAAQPRGTRVAVRVPLD